MKKKVLVIGSAGFIGKYVCENLNDNNYDVITFDKKSNPNQDTVTFNDTVAKLYGMDDIDYVVNLAGLVGLKHCLDNPVNAVYQNVLGVTRLLEYYKNKPVKFLHISTWATTGNLINPYDVTKLAGENMVKSYMQRGLIDGIILRLGTAYGKGMSEYGVIPTMVKKMKANLPLTIFGRGEQIRQFTHAKDIANAITILLEKGENKIYYCVADEITSIKQIAESLSDDIEYVSEREGEDTYEPLVAIELKSLGWKQTIAFKDGMKEMKK